MKGTIKHAFAGKLWQHPSPGGWHFISLPVETAQEIRATLKSQEEGWGRLKVTAKIGSTEWKTAIWFDSKRSTYLLPVKAGIRKKENLGAKAAVDVEVWV